MRRWLLPAFLLLLSGCGYHLVGTASFLPPEIKTLHVERFENHFLGRHGPAVEVLTQVDSA
jgi:outer membrane lipopolysaccharide assembly protein LptE/RlpB